VGLKPRGGSSPLQRTHRAKSGAAARRHDDFARSRSFGRAAVSGDGQSPSPRRGHLGRKVLHWLKDAAISSADTAPRVHGGKRPRVGRRPAGSADLRSAIATTARDLVRACQGHVHQVTFRHACGAFFRFRRLRRTANVRYRCRTGSRSGSRPFWAQRPSTSEHMGTGATTQSSRCLGRHPQRVRPTAAAGRRRRSCS
jgi:hypothetical protein